MQVEESAANNITYEAFVAAQARNNASTAHGSSGISAFNAQANQESKYQFINIVDPGLSTYHPEK